MCFGATGAEEEATTHEGPFEVTNRVKDVFGNFKKSHNDPVRFVIVLLKNGKIDYHDKVRLAKCTYEDYMREVGKVVAAGQLASVLHWFRLKTDIKYVRLSFDPKDGKVSEEDTKKFFDTIKNYLAKKYPKITLLELSGSTIKELSMDKLEDEYELRYPGH